MSYITGHSITPRQLFTTLKRDSISTTGDPTQRHKDIFAGKVFMYFMYILLLDIIHNGITFRLPVRSDAFIEMYTVSDDDFVKARQNGAFHHVDYLESNFTGNYLQFRYKLKADWRRKTIYVSNVLKRIITDYTNKGKKY